MAVDPKEFQKAFVECRDDPAAVAANSPQPLYPNIYLLAAAQGQRNQTPRRNPKRSMALVV
jgi:hypothetical protein